MAVPWKKVNKYAVVDLNSGFVYATFTNKKEATEMITAFKMLDKVNGAFDEQYGVIIEKP
jgi:hypothetical protein